MNPAVTDRSVPRLRVNAGDTSMDRRGRARGVMPILSYGFRPFFLGASIYAAVAVPLWLWMLASGAETAGSLTGTAWHAHEMIFGYVSAVMAGFILTAVPNWTGRLPLSGAPLALLFFLWLAGRIGSLLASSPMLALTLDLAFPIALAGAIWREVVAGSNWRNAPIALLLTLFACANLLHHLEGVNPLLEGFGVRLALGVAALLMALIGGRVTPSFTRNWLAKRSHGKLPASFGWIDRAALLVTAAGIAAWLAAPDRPLSGVMLAATGVLLFVRLARWRGLAAWREPIVLILHVGYLWLAAALLMLGCSIVEPHLVPQSAALHALTAGAVATMTLAVMTRASLGHTGRAIGTDAATLMTYILVTTGALLRVAAPFFPEFHMELLVGGGATWSLAFALFALRYGPMLLQARLGQESKAS